MLTVNTEIMATADVNIGTRCNGSHTPMKIPLESQDFRIMTLLPVAFIVLGINSLFSSKFEASDSQAIRQPEMYTSFTNRARMTLFEDMPPYAK